MSTWSAHNGKVVLLLAFGKHMLSVGSDGRLLIWPVVEADPTTPAHPVGSIQLRESFTPTCIMHPDTYLNKVLHLRPLSLNPGLHLIGFGSESVVYRIHLNLLHTDK